MLFWGGLFVFAEHIVERFHIPAGVVADDDGCYDKANCPSKGCPFNERFHALVLFAEALAWASGGGAGSNFPFSVMMKGKLTMPSRVM